MKIVETSWETIRVPATRTISLVRIERSENQRSTSISRAPDAQRPEGFREHRGAAVDLVRLPVLVDPDRNGIEAAGRVTAPRLEHRLHGRILVHADARGPRVGRERFDDLGSGAQHR